MVIFQLNYVHVHKNIQRTCSHFSHSSTFKTHKNAVLRSDRNALPQRIAEMEKSKNGIASTSQVIDNV